jgi:hypothetical protein
MAMSLEDVFLRLVTEEETAVGEAGGEDARRPAREGDRTG